jgi:hypothetical protein
MSGMTEENQEEKQESHSDEAYEQRRLRAVERLKMEPPQAWFYPVIGLHTDQENVQLWEGIKFQRIQEGPNAFELGAALEDRRMFLKIGRYCEFMEWEIVIPWNVGDPSHVAGTWGRVILDALRVRTQASLLVPAGCNHSWSSLNAFKDQSCKSWVMEDAPAAKIVGPPVTIRESDFQWVADYIGDFADRLGHGNFETAAEALASHFQHGDYRVMTALLWAGIEALFGISQELSHRLAAYIALALEPRGRACSDLYRRVKKLYNVRSKAVHGGAVGDNDLCEHIIEVRGLLSRLLCRFTEAAWLPDEQDFEDMLLMNPGADVWPGKLGPLTGLEGTKPGEISRKGNPHRKNSG